MRRGGAEKPGPACQLRAAAALGLAHPAGARVPPRGHRGPSAGRRRRASGEGGGQGRSGRGDPWSRSPRASSTCRSPVRTSSTRPDSVWCSRPPSSGRAPSRAAPSRWCSPTRRSGWRWCRPRDSRAGLPRSRRRSGFDCTRPCPSMSEPPGSPGTGLGTSRLSSRWLSTRSSSSTRRPSTPWASARA